MPITEGLLAGLASSGVSTIGNLIGGLFSNNKQFKQQQQLAEQQFNYQKQLNQMAMDYNSPINQMQLWRKAGINPNAVVGNTTSISGGSVGQGSAPSPNLQNIGSSAMQAFADAYNLDAQRQQAIAASRAALSQSKALDADALKKLSETKGIDISNDILQSQAADFKQKINLENALVRSQIAEAESKATLNELLATKQVTENRNLQSIIDADLAKTAASIKLMLADGKLKSAQAVDALASAMQKKAETEGIKLSNNIAKATAYDYIEQFATETEKAKSELKHMRNENDWYGWNHTIGSALQGVGLFVSPGKFFNMPKKIKGFH